MSKGQREPTQGEIQLRAYRIWQWLGAPDGYEDEIWQRAERELRAEIAKGQATERAIGASAPHAEPQQSAKSEPPRALRAGQ